MKKETVVYRMCGLRHQMQSAALYFHRSKMLYLYTNHIILRKIQCTNMKFTEHKLFSFINSVLTWILHLSMHKCVLGSFNKLTTFPRNADLLVLYGYLIMPTPPRAV